MAWKTHRSEEYIIVYDEKTHEEIWVQRHPTKSDIKRARLFATAPKTATERDALQAQLVRLRAALEAAQEQISHAADCPARHSGECLCLRAEIAETLADTSPAPSESVNKELLVMLKDATASLEVQATIYHYRAARENKTANTATAEELRRNVATYRAAIAKAESRSREGR